MTASAIPDELRKHHSVGVRSLVFPIVVLLLGTLIRFALLSSPALIDPSEGRFASVSQHMVLSEDYLTPRIHRFGREWIPYWAKPPLHMWLVAFSLKLFGSTEFAARFPSCLATTLTLGLVLLFAYRFFSLPVALFSGLAYLSFGGVFIFSQGCTTDATLAFFVSAAHVAFAYARASERPSVSFSYDLLFFFSVALGTLVKGPVAIALTGVVVGARYLMVRDWISLREIPWVGGVCLFLLVATPWYLLAEHATPGFLRYFLINENLLRYLVHDFGIKYGSAHTHFRGMIWLMAVAVMIPWSFFALPVFRIVRGQLRKKVQELPSSPALALCCAWAVGPLFFFTFARQVLPTYTYSALPAYAILIGVVLSKLEDHRYRWEPYLMKGGVALLGIAAFTDLFSIIVSRGFTSLTLALSIAIVALFLLRDYAHRSGVLEGQVPFFLGALLLTYASIFPAFDPSLARRSMKFVLTEMGRSLPEGAEALAVLYSDPPSGQFYSHVTLPPGVAYLSGYSIEMANEKRITDALIQKNDMSKIPQAERGLWVPRKELGKWILLGKEGSQRTDG